MSLKNIIAALLLLGLSLQASERHAHDRYDRHGCQAQNHHRPSAWTHHGQYYRPQHVYVHKPQYQTYRPAKVIHHHSSHNRFDATDAIIIGTTLGIIIGSQLAE